MTDISIAPESLTKLVWRFTGTSLSPSSTVIVEDLDGEPNDYYPIESLSSKSDTYTTGENVNLIERYLLEVIHFFSKTFHLNYF